MNIFSSKIYKLKCENINYSEGDVLNSIEWYDGDYDITRYLENVTIEKIGENILTIDTNRDYGRFEDIWICDIASIK